MTKEGEVVVINGTPVKLIPSGRAEADVPENMRDLPETASLTDVIQAINFERAQTRASYLAPIAVWPDTEDRNRYGAAAS